MQQRRRYNQRPYHRNRSQQPQQQQPGYIQPKKNLDINCDVGQGFGINQNPFEEKVLPYVTSINVACGAHAGDPHTMARVIDLARNHNVSIGALIGYHDLVGNGEREMYLGVDELRAMVLYQLGALNALLHSKGLEIRHVRTHGFLYKQLYTDQITAETVAKAIAEFDRWITLVGLSGPVLGNACTNANIRIGQEVQVTRRYRKDGTILPFNPSIDGKNYLDRAASMAREIIQSGNITCEDSSRIRVNVNTIHIPSDSEESIELARTVRAMVSDPKPLHLDKYDKYFADLASLKE